MKKGLTILLSVVMVFAFFACGEKEAEGYEIGMVTDVGTIDDKSFNQGTWEGVKAYGDENDMTYKYYQPSADTDDARMEQIDNAIKNGAKVIVTPGFLFEKVIYNAQAKYPDVTFLFIDGAPKKDKDSPEEIAENTAAISFAEEEAGYLAGYAAIKDGYKKLGFMGGIPVPAVTRYGYGFVQGANDAAKEFGVKDVEIKYNYTNTFNASPDIKAKATGWYKDGTEVIFSCGGGIFASISAAADETKAKVIGVDVDQSSQSKTVITSAMKNLGGAVDKVLSDFYGGKFEGGKHLTLGLTDDSVALPMETSIFEKFTQDDYDKLVEKLKAGEVKIANDTDGKTVADIVTKFKLDTIRVTSVK